MPELNTFSIVGQCPETRCVGVAVATAVPAVGSMCPFTRPGVGAVSTQSWVNPYLAIAVLDAMAGGATASDALARALFDDPARELRQIGVVDAAGRAASWSGSGCTGWFGHEVGEGFAVQGNMLTGPEVIAAMAQAWRAGAGRALGERLMRAMEAGDRAGGDKRGKQSAALRIQGAEDYPALDLRVDEHAEPVKELRRVLDIAVRQLVPFVEGMPKRGAPPGPAPEEVTQLLARAPQDRPGGTGDNGTAARLAAATGLPPDAGRLQFLLAQFAPILREIELLRSVDLAAVHPPVIFDPTLPYRRMQP
ncbi:DUF1028 domain-containing protein [Ancylobacter sp. 6x-1]|uniref:DUF1028 domain-containing protein n=1 Tax=Ancylobacter crimeensis TaxID=2579147 RepID=A0ABT0DFJ5_9HYPH|nr:DUF1028 domain-containing protein [Ancylobacter crimeensis]MCK0198746.1 DUF1028 domain-containing protein [Ancylobacter crimeensis]